jgi:arsenate reductase (thioredoxin)
MVDIQIVFVCPHGAAKSVLAAAYCHQLANQQHIPLKVVAVGTEPDAEISPAVVALLDTEGLDVPHARPRRLTRADLQTATRVIAIGCDLAELAQPGLVIERWDDVPPASENLLEARDRIQAHVRELLVSLAHTPVSASEREHEVRV